MLRCAKTILTIVVAILVGACGRGDRHVDVDRRVFPVKGIDVSSHNGEIDFAKVREDTVSFVFIKATEGTDFCDAFFVRNYTNAKDAGLKVGAYHFFRFDEPGHMQAYHFLSSLRGRVLDLPLAIDVEDSYNAENIATEDIVQQLQTMIEVVRAEGYKPVVYTNKSGYKKYIKNNFPDVPLWICTFSSVPTLTDAPWIFWQHSHEGRVNGINGNVDLNTFNGVAPDFEAFTVKLDSLPMF